MKLLLIIITKDVVVVLVIIVVVVFVVIIGVVVVVVVFVVVDLIVVQQNISRVGASLSLQCSRRIGQNSGQQGTGPTMQTLPYDQDVDR